MNLPDLRAVHPKLVFGGLAAIAILAVWGAQRSAAAPGQMAQIGPGAPLPVFVVNEQTLPDDFVPGSTWRFETWTVPNAMSWTARVERVSGGWAYLNVYDAGRSASGWYYVPQMPGRWQRQ